MAPPLLSRGPEGRPDPTMHLSPIRALAIASGRRSQLYNRSGRLVASAMPGGSLLLPPRCERQPVVPPRVRSARLAGMSGTPCRSHPLEPQSSSVQAAAARCGRDRTRATVAAGGVGSEAASCLAPSSAPGKVTVLVGRAHTLPPGRLGFVRGASHWGVLSEPLIKLLNVRALQSISSVLAS